MKSIYPYGVALALGLCCLATSAQAQDATYRSPVLFPVPQSNYTVPTESQPAAYPAVQTSAEAGAWSTPGYRQPYLVGARNEYEYGSGVPMNELPNPPEPGPVVEPADEYAPTPMTFDGKSVKGHGHGHHCTASCWLRCSMARWLGHDYIGHMHGSLCGSCWYGSVGGLVMNRDNGNRFVFSNGRWSPGLGVLDVRDAEMDWSGGAEVRVGRYLHGGTYAIEGVYWGIYPTSKEAVLLDDQVNGNLDSNLDFWALDIDGTNVDAWTDNSDAHRVRRDWEFHNVEINLLNYAGCMMFDVCGSPRFKFNWGIGARFFRFEEDLQFAAIEDGFGDVFDGGADQINYDVGVENNLVGFQLIGNSEYFCRPNFSLLLGTKFGLYGNHISHRQIIYSENGVAVVNQAPFWDQQYNIKNSKDDVAFLGEINAGANWYLSSSCSLGFGYRAVAATGVALAQEQIPYSLGDLRQARLVDSNGSLILHGAYLNLTVNY